MKKEIGNGEFLESRSPLFLFAFTHIGFLTSVAATWIVAWLLVSWQSHEWMWFARSGSLVAIVGGTLSARSVLRVSHEERERMRRMTIVETFTPTELEDQARDALAMQIGVVLILFGTLVWAYGDLIGRLFGKA